MKKLQLIFKSGGNRHKYFPEMPMDIKGDLGKTVYIMPPVTTIIGDFNFPDDYEGMFIVRFFTEDETRYDYHFLYPLTNPCSVDTLDGCILIFKNKNELLSYLHDIEFSNNVLSVTAYSLEADPNGAVEAVHSFAIPFLGYDPDHNAQSATGVKPGWKLPTDCFSGLNVVPMVSYLPCTDAYYLDWLDFPSLAIVSDAIDAETQTTQIDMSSDLWPFVEGYDPRPGDWEALGFLFRDYDFFCRFRSFDDWMSVLNRLNGMSDRKVIESNETLEGWWLDGLTPNEVYRSNLGLVPYYGQLRSGDR